ncbi:MAG: hypothetical protein Q4G39_00055 [Brachymonas sp.]|nr:hypothetical protein [Brachymonas sp.]
MRTIGKQTRTLAALLLATAGLGACAQAGNRIPSLNPASTSQVFKSFGLRQCEGGAADLQPLARQLEGAGIAVQASTCGHDGMMRPAVCGAGDGRIAIFQISSTDVAAAQRLGFAPLSHMPDAQTSSCR